MTGRRPETDEDGPGVEVEPPGDVGGCTLCGLPLDDTVTASDVDGQFCCQGCLTVARQLDAVDGETPPFRQQGDRQVGDSPGEPFGSTADPEEVDGEEAFLSVEGMHCTTCEAFLEHRASAQDGVDAATASYAAGLLRVGYDPAVVDEGRLTDLVSGAGYDATAVADAGDAGPQEADSERVGRLIVGGFFGMMVMLWYILFLYPVYLGVSGESLLIDPTGQAGSYLRWNLWVLATIVLGYTGYPILRGAYVSLRAGEPNMDLLVALAATTAYLHSAVATVLGHTAVYFDVTVVIVFVVTLGNHYETRLRNRASAELAGLATRQVETARRRTTNGTEEVPLAEVESGDAVVVREGERLPLDGRVREGQAAVDEALVTGESVPVRKAVGSDVVGGSEIVDGALVVAVDDAERNTLDRVTRRLWTLQSGRRDEQRLVDRIAGVFVPLVLLLAAGAAVAHLALGATTTAALLTGLAVLIVSCPCALGLATPLSVASGLREALASGIVVTDRSAFERATEADVVALDKTGTLTTGDLELVERPDPEVLADAAAVEQFADHPLAGAVVGAAPTTDATVTEVETAPGRGAGGTVDGRRVLVGNPDLFSDRGWAVSEDLQTRFEGARDEGRVAALVGRDGVAEGLVAAADAPRDDWETVVAELADQRDVVVLTGDESAAADRFRDHPAVSDVYAGLPPEAKERVVEHLRERGTVAMVGDGSNDAPALAAADVGIALADGTALAVEAADVAVTTDDLSTIPRVFDVTQATKRRIRQNIGWAFVYNAVAVPVAALGLLSPLVAAVAMASSSLLVVGNASRPLLE
jgi:Cu2+-exporting ATPase